ncbi:MAG: hypothetical protein CMI23_12965 [Opitutae bacterium]|jgi:hypothetical protein|nr:hypothetical protein [Opitutae bacterium]|tara:strand:+ start:2860 stop:3417 length:558 start_codon:yes stop_codon:yes gene_type:complete
MVMGASNAHHGEDKTWVNYLSQYGYDLHNAAVRGTSCDILIDQWENNKWFEPDLVLLDTPPYFRFHLYDIAIGGMGQDVRYTDWLKENRMYHWYKKRWPFRTRDQFDQVVDALNDTLNDAHNARGMETLYRRQRQHVDHLKLLANVVELPQPGGDYDELHYTQERHKEMAKIADKIIDERILYAS